MSIVTISRGTYTRGKEVAEKVAKQLGYECIARETIVEASREFNIPEVKLVRALHDAPSILEKFSYGKEKFVAYYQVAFLEHLQKDNIVYHGLAGHFLLNNAPNALKVRIIADMEERVKLEMWREGISEQEAYHILKTDDHERRKWSQHLYGIDTDDPSLYDLVIRIKRMTVQDAVDIICHTVGMGRFQTSAESREVFEDMLLAARAKVAVIDQAPNAAVTAKRGVVTVVANSTKYHEEEFINTIKQAILKVPGAEDVEVDITPIMPFGD